MKQIYHILLLITSISLNAQKLPTGVTADNSQYLSNTFIYSDSNEVFWAGVGNIPEGLLQYENNIWNKVIIDAYVYDAFEIRKGQLYFPSTDGLYFYDGNSFQLDNSIVQLRCIEKYNNDLYISSKFNKIYIKSGSQTDSIYVSINGVSPSIILDMYSYNSYLWIGTDLGLVRYDGSNFKLYQLPVINVGDPNVEYQYATVNSISSDASGRIWAGNINLTPTESGLFAIINDSLQSIVKLYPNLSCDQLKLIPSRVNALRKNAANNIITGLYQQVLEFTPTSIKSYITSPELYSYDNYCYPGIYAVTDVNNKILLSSNILYTINPSQYDISNYKKTIYPNISFNKININDIKASVANDGIIFDQKTKLDNSALPTFNIPSVSCASPMFSAAIWLGGINASDNQLHLAAQTYRQTGSDFLPGPIDTVTHQYDSTLNSAYNKVWRINRKTIDDFILNRLNAGYVIPSEILEWPAHGTGNFSRNLAPFVDVDGNKLYEPSKGDYPKIKGDQMLWWVFNDAGLHTETGGSSMGVEIHGSCYAYWCHDLTLKDSNYIVNRTVFFDYKIINRSLDDYKDFRTGIFNDVELGNYYDDYIGCNVANNCGYVHNGDMNDEGRDGFGKNPPMLLCKFLNQPMSGFMYYYNNFDAISGNPQYANDYYNFMNSKWKNGNSFRFGSNGISGAIPTKYMYDNGTNPATSSNPKWTEYTAGNQPGDRRMLMSASTGTLKAGGTFDLEFAYLFVNDSSTNLFQNFNQKPLQGLRIIQNFYDNNNFPECDQSHSKISSITKEETLVSIYPNPANDQVTIQSALLNKDIKAIYITDISGRVLQSITHDTDSGSLNLTLAISEWPKGIYIIQVETVNGIIAKKLIKY